MGRGQREEKGMKIEGEVKSKGEGRRRGERDRERGGREEGREGERKKEGENMMLWLNSNSANKIHLILNDTLLQKNDQTMCQSRQKQFKIGKPIPNSN